MAQSYQYPQL